MGFVVSFVIPGSSLEKAGLKVGDVLVAIDNKNVLDWEEKLSIYEKEDKINNMLTKMCLSPDEVHKFTVLRISNGTVEKKEISFSPDKLFNLELKYLTNTNVINAWTDGKTFYITKKLVDFLEDEDLIAAVIAHETGHALLNQPDSTRKRATVGGIAGLILDIAAATAGIDTRGAFTRLGAGVRYLVYSKQQEREADYTMMYLLALSGYNYEKAPELFRKFAQLDPNSIKGSFISTHPGNAERTVFLQKVVEEVKGRSVDQLKRQYREALAETKKENEEKRERKGERKTEAMTNEGLR
ncbi:MAG: M48 family metalloprotease [Caldimicrobium sp.]